MRQAIPVGVVRRKTGAVAREVRYILAASLICLGTGAAHAQATPLLKIHVTGEDGQAAPGAEVMVVPQGDTGNQIPNRGKWQPATGGDITYSLDDLPDVFSERETSPTQYKVFARAPGFALSTAEVPANIETNAAAVANLTMQPGREVAIQLLPPEGKQVPPDLKPLIVPKDYVPAAWVALAGKGETDPINLPVNARGNGVFTFNIDNETPPLFVMVDHPGFLRYWQPDMEMSTTATAAQPMKLELPEPSTVTVKFENPYADQVPPDATPALEFTKRQRVPGKTTWLLQAGRIENKPGVREWTIDDLSPGEYYVYASEGVVESDRQEIKATVPGGQTKVLLAGQSVIPPIVAVDENGTTLTDFSARLAGKTRMGSFSHGWNSIGTDSKDAVVRFARSALSNSYANRGTDEDFQVEVRAPGYAVNKVDVQAGPPDASPVVVKLDRGKTLTVRLKSADGRPIPEDLKPLALSAEQFSDAMNYLSSPENAPSLAIGERTGPDTFKFHLPSGTKYFRVAFNDDDFLKHYGSEPIAEIPDETLEIELPRPGTIRADVTLTSAPLKGDDADQEEKYSVRLTRTFKSQAVNYKVSIDTFLTGITTSTVLENLPPGDYELTAQPFRSYQQDSSVPVKVEAGETITVALEPEPRSTDVDEYGRPLVKLPSVKVTQSDGKPVKGAQVIARKKSTRYIPTLKWSHSGAEGLIKPQVEPNFGESGDGAYELLVRAPGFVTQSTTVTLPTSATVTDVALSAGQQVKLQLKDDSGRGIPAELIPAVFPESWGQPVWMTAQNREENVYAPETLLSPVAVVRAEGGATAPGIFTLNIDPESTESLYVLINQPGFLRAFQAGPFAPADWASSGTLELNLPKPVSLSGTLDLDGRKPESSVVTMEIGLTKKLPGAGLWGLNMIVEELPATSASLSADDLAPGEYDVGVTMAPQLQRYSGQAFSTEKKTTLAAGESKSFELKYTPFQKEWLEGPYTAKVKVLNQKGEPAVGAPYKLTWYSRGYPTQTIAEGNVPENGLVVIKDLAGIEKSVTREEARELEHGIPSFTFHAVDQRLGNISFFEYSDNKYHPAAEKTKDFEFRIPPKEGDIAPDFAMHDIVTSKTIHLSDLKGQVVLIDFWATWCGPCQGPMAENQEVMRKMKDEWKGKAVILAVSIDDELETVIKHLDKNDWHETHNTWAAPDPAKPDDVGWKAPAAQMYGINSIPTMMLIDADGVIRERGHISDIQSTIEGAIKAASAKVERKGGGDLGESHADVIRPPSTETSYSATPSGAAAIVKSPGTETSYSAATPARKPVRVALFADPGSTDKKSREAMWNVLSAAKGIDADKVTTETVRAPGFFDNYDVFILPGGTGSGEARAIGVEAGKRIAERLHEGKGLVAVCAGGYYVAEGWNPPTAALDVINAQNHDGEHWARGEQFIKVEVVGSNGDTTSSRTMWFENGPIFKPGNLDDLPGYVPLVKYVTDLAAKDAPKGQMAGRDAVIAAPYGQGRVVAFGPHPELSPALQHWLINAITWAARQRGDDTRINADIVLEGHEQ